jgi:hypothetical protein
VTQKMGSNSSNSSKQLLMTFKSTLKRSSPKGPKPPCNSQELDSAGCQQILRIGAKLHPMRHGIPVESWAKGDPWPMTFPFRSQLRSTETSE